MLHTYHTYVEIRRIVHFEQCSRFLRKRLTASRKRVVDLHRNLAKERSLSQVSLCFGFRSREFEFVQIFVRSRDREFMHISAYNISERKESFSQHFLFLGSIRHRESFFGKQLSERPITSLSQEERFVFA